MRILIAPNTFKNSLDAMAAAEAIQRGLERSRLRSEYSCFPIADGGDGTAPLIVRQRNGQWMHAEVTGPLGFGVQARFGLIDQGKTAVIEMADASGLRLVGTGKNDPTMATSAGTGELIAMALDCGVSSIIIGVGGSATVDGAAGALSALGVQFTDASGQGLSPDPSALADLKNIDISGLNKKLAACRIIVLCDVKNKLLGPDGAAAVFGSQKGASPEQILQLDQFLSRFSGITRSVTGIDMADIISGGAAGGAAAGFHAYLGAELQHGINSFLRLTNFTEALRQTDLVITGEGSLDAQTLQGKGPFGVAEAAKRMNIPVIGIAGRIPLTDLDELRKYFDVLLPIGNQPALLENALADTAINLERTAMEFGNTLYLRSRK